MRQRMSSPEENKMF